ncbi:hypothetical protein MBM_07674 [Drepanopeziza brunnea f. sp. 'multigermtubi' MB_m1]|uniref:Uncharacterized protein n=1 Tax=Marssonina brunnea f. sp. multigermtubi (strain MB_m1) TaxID=1072389 RepID=K1WNS5_MARBU|nr:uncharacterized protein MBM_07674 [Drepanopeziza brunnea f. sp. 'multigermtubi' MB_m1]EKD13997.1 hypothetical protein MBM_07674 [Drepanopeziza brunnea f. sp. 'multigermtubi' MB_m1]
MVGGGGGGGSGGGGEGEGEGGDGDGGAAVDVDVDVDVDVVVDGDDDDDDDVGAYHGPAKGGAGVSWDSGRDAFPARADPRRESAEEECKESIVPPQPKPESLCRTSDDDDNEAREANEANEANRTERCALADQSTTYYIVLHTTYLYSKHTPIPASWRMGVGGQEHPPIAYRVSTDYGATKFLRGSVAPWLRGSVRRTGRNRRAAPPLSNSLPPQTIRKSGGFLMAQSPVNSTV